MSLKSFSRILIVISILILSRSCITFKSIDQPDTADPNSFFDVNVTLDLNCDSTQQSDEAVYFGMLIPNGWTVRDSISYSGFYDGVLTYSPVYTDSMNNYFFSKPEGYYWWIAVASETLNPLDTVRTGAVSLSPRVITDDQTGQFFISYTVTTDLSFYHGGGYDYDHPVSIDAQPSMTVTNTNDNGPGSFREALRQVANGGEINFDLDYPDSIVIDSQLVIQGSVTINGPGKDSLKISGDNKCRILYHGLPSLFTINISGLTISNGFAEESNGGGIWISESNLNMENVNIFGNRGIYGGGISVTGNSLKFSHVNISNNYAKFNGGGIDASFSESFEISNSFICNNSAETGNGAISSFCQSGISTVSKCTIINSTIAGNSTILGEAIGKRCSYDVKLKFNIINSILWNKGNEISIESGSSPIMYSAEVKILHSSIQKGQILHDSHTSINWLEGNIESDPMLVNEGNGIYSLQEDSPCIDAGVADYSLNGITVVNLNPDEYIGSAPDMGAFEYGMTTEIYEHEYMPDEFVLHQNYPNPFNPATIIQYSIPVVEALSTSASLSTGSVEGRLVTLKVYNILGKEVATLVDEQQRPGNYEVKWDASGQASGVYFYKLTSGQFIETKKMVLLR